MIIGIGGVSNSGKSRLANQIKEHLDDLFKVIILCQDDFAKPRTMFPKIKGHSDWECPSSIDHDRFYHAVIQSNTSYDIVIAEGLFAFHDARLLKLYNKRIFISISKETFLKRKSKDLRWGKEPKWYMEHIWNNHLLYGQAEANQIDLFSVNADNHLNFEAVLEYLSLNDSIIYYQHVIPPLSE